MTQADGDPDPAYCDFVAAATEAGRALDTPPDLPPALRRAGHLLAAVRAAGRLSSTRLKPPDLVATPRRVGRFELMRELGRGGAGAVFEARDPALGRAVALKVLHPALAVRPDWAARFRAEGPALARLRHPNVVQVFEAGEADGVTFLAMELVPGPDLHARLAGGPLPARAAAELVAALADGLAHAHAAGVLHRDLKPHNVLLDPAGGPKVADFGLAAPLDGGGTGLTATGEVVGTPNYLAPESLDGAADARTDVYGLGAVLYECLTGRPPFVGSNAALTLLQVRTADPVSPRSLNPEVPRDLDTVCLKCLSKTPAERYATADAVAADLRAFLAGRPVTARPPGLAERLAKWVRRRPAAAGGLAAGLLALLAGLAGWAEHTRRLAVEIDRVTREQAATAAALEAERAAFALAERRRVHLTGVVGVLQGVFADLDVKRLRNDKLPLERALADRLVAAGDRMTDDDLGDPVQLAAVRRSLGLTLLSLGCPESGVPLLRSAADALAAHPEFGPDHDRTLTALGDLAVAHKQTGRTDLALPVLRDLHARSARTHGPDARPTLKAQHDLVAALHAAGRRDEANAAGDDLYGRATKALGPDDPIAIEAESLWINRESLSAAVRVERYAALVERSRRVFGDTSPHTIGVRQMHAATLSFAGRAAEAVPLFQALSAGADAAGGPDRPDAVQAVYGLAQALDKGGRHPEAALAYADAVARVERQGFKLFVAQKVVAGAAGHAERQGRHPVAEGWWRKWAAFTEAQALDTSTHAKALGSLSRNLLDQKQYAEAETALLACHAAWAKRPGSEKNVREVAGWLADLYAAWDRPADAARWRAGLPGR